MTTVEERIMKEQEEEIRLLNVECEIHADKVIEMQNRWTAGTIANRQLHKNIDNAIRALMKGRGPYAIVTASLDNMGEVLSDVYKKITYDGQTTLSDFGIGEEQMLNKENVIAVLTREGGTATVGKIAEETASSAKAVYRFVRKHPDTFVAGKLPGPDYKEENAIVWLESQPQVSEPETVGDEISWRVDESAKPSEEGGDATDDKGDQPGPAVDEGGDPAGR